MFILTLCELFSTCVDSLLEMVAFSDQILDAGSLMFDIHTCTDARIEKHPVFSACQRLKRS
jgi:hypothetical protein